MRSLVGAAAEDDDMDDAPPPKRRAKPRAKGAGPRVARPKRRGDSVSRWRQSMHATGRRMLFWAFVLAVFFGLVAVGGLFSGGHVSAATRSMVAAFNNAMVGAGLTVQSVTLEGRGETAQGEIVRMLGIKRGTPMLYVDVDEAR